MTRFFESILHNDRNSITFLGLMSLIFFIGLGAFHLFDWDEINFAESAREMIVSGDYLHVQINFEPFWEKPPFFFWLQVVSMNIFGVTEFAARFPNAVFGVIYMITFYLIGRKHFDRKFGLIWSLLFFASLLPHIYFKSGIIDPVFNYFIFLSIYFMILVLEKPENHGVRNAVIAGLLSGFSVITKGPVGFLLLGLTLFIYLLIKRFRLFPKIKYILLFFSGLLFIVGCWMLMEYLQNGYDMLLKFIRYQIELFNSPVAGHEQPFYYHFVVVFLGCFPMSVFALPSILKSKESIPYNLDKWMRTLFWVVIILFSVVTTKIIHYSSMTYIPLSFLAALTLYRIKGEKVKFNKILLGILAFIGIIVSSAITAVIYIFSHKDDFMYLFKDQFTHDAMSIHVDWSGYEPLSGMIYLAGVVFAIVLLIKKQILPALTSFAAGTALTLLSLQFFAMPKIEQHTQGPLIDLCLELKQEDAYMETYGFKSYATYYYGETPQLTQEQKDMGWLMKGNIDKPVYLISKSNNTELDNYPGFSFIQQKGGFRVYKREAE